MLVTTEPPQIFFDTEYINSLRLNENEIIKKNLNLEIINYQWVDKYDTTTYHSHCGVHKYKKVRSKEEMLNRFSDTHFYEYRILLKSWCSMFKKFKFTNLKSVNNPTNKGCQLSQSSYFNKLTKEDLFEWCRLNNIKYKKSMKYKDIVLLLWNKL